MTLIIAIPTKNSVVFSSDSQITIGEVRASGKKIYKLNNRCLWGASGVLSLAQRFRDTINNSANQSGSLAELRDNLARIICDITGNLINLDYRTKFYMNDPENLINLYPADFLFVECLENKSPTILHMSSFGNSEWVENRFAATGNGSSFALALLQKYSSLLNNSNTLSLTTETAKLLAYKVIEESIQVGSYGLGGPINMWEITNASGETSIKEASESEIAALEDAARTLREKEVDMLVNN